MARQDESDDLEASTITGLEASQQSISAQDIEVDENEAIPIPEVAVPESVAEGEPTPIEEPETDDTEALETASVITVQSIHSVVPIEHTSNETDEPTEVEVQDTPSITEGEESNDTPEAIAEEALSEDAVVDQAPEVVEPSEEPTEPEIPAEQEPEPPTEAVPMADIQEEQSPEDMDLTAATAVADDPIPEDEATPESSEKEAIPEPPTEEVPQDSVEIGAVEDIPATEEIDSHDHTEPDSAPVLLENDAHPDEQPSIPDIEEETENIPGVVEPDISPVEE